MRKTPNAFPFYPVDATSWQGIRGKTVHAVWQDLEAHIMASILSEEIELLQLITLDSHDRLIDSQIIAAGTIDHISVKLRYVAEKALKDKVNSIVLAHNHTSGDTTPSWDDVTYTKEVNHAFSLLKITLLDHLIVARESVFSMRKNCLIF